MFKLSIYILILANFSMQSRAADAELEMFFSHLNQESPLEGILINNNWKNNIPIDSNHHYCDFFNDDPIIDNQAPTSDYCPPQLRNEQPEIIVKVCNIPAPEYIVPRIIPQPIFLNTPIYEEIYTPFNGLMIPDYLVYSEQPFEDSMDNDEIPEVSLERLPNGKSPVLRAFLISIEKKIGGVFINKKAGLIKITNFGALLDNVEKIYHSKNIIRPNRVKALKPWFSGWPCRINFEKHSEFTLRVNKEKKAAYLKYFSLTEK